LKGSSDAAEGSPDGATTSRKRYVRIAEARQAGDGLVEALDAPQFPRILF